LNDRKNIYHSRGKGGRSAKWHPIRGKDKVRRLYQEELPGRNIHP